MDGVERMSSVVAADKAAATYLTPFEQRGYTYLDGGIWANNPTMVALVGPFPASLRSRRTSKFSALDAVRSLFASAKDKRGTRVWSIGDPLSKLLYSFRLSRQ